jgi:hypothetical protein
VSIHYGSGALKAGHFGSVTSENLIGICAHEKMVEVRCGILGPFKSLLLELSIDATGGANHNDKIDRDIATPTRTQDKRELSSDLFSANNF